MSSGDLFVGFAIVGLVVATVGICGVTAWMAKKTRDLANEAVVDRELTYRAVVSREADWLPKLGPGAEAVITNVGGGAALGVIIFGSSPR